MAGPLPLDLFAALLNKLELENRTICRMIHRQENMTPVLTTVQMDSKYQTVHIFQIDSTKQYHYPLAIKHGWLENLLEMEVSS